MSTRSTVPFASQVLASAASEEANFRKMVDSYWALVDLTDSPAPECSPSLPVRQVACDFPRLPQPPPDQGHEPRDHRLHDRPCLTIVQRSHKRAINSDSVKREFAEIAKAMVPCTWKQLWSWAFSAKPLPPHLAARACNQIAWPSLTTNIVWPKERPV